MAAEKNLRGHHHVPTMACLDTPPSGNRSQHKNKVTNAANLKPLIPLLPTCKDLLCVPENENQRTYPLRHHPRDSAGLSSSGKHRHLCKWKERSRQRKPHTTQLHHLQQLMPSVNSPRATMLSNSTVPGRNTGHRSARHPAGAAHWAGRLALCFAVMSRRRTPGLSVPGETSPSPPAP